MRRFLFGVAFLLAVSVQVSAQNCTQTLRTARSTYEQGRLHEIEGLLDDCLKNTSSTGFNSTQRVEAYRILVLTYIYLEEPQKADDAMLKLLNEDHFFKINKVSDPIEFQSLYKKFRTTPVFNYGVKAGMNSNNINVLKNYYLFGSAQGQGTYKPVLSYQFGLLFEKDLIPEKLTINPELFYSAASFEYRNDKISSSDPNDAPAEDDMTYSIDHTRLQLNCLFQFRFLKGRVNETLAPYVSLGPSVYYLMNSTFSGDLTLTSQTTIPSLETTDNYKSLGFGVVGSAGLKYKIGSVYVTADVRYVYGLNNVVNPDSRYKKNDVNQTLWDAGYIDNDFKLSQSMINLGLIIPYFNPKKLIR